MAIGSEPEIGLTFRVGPMTHEDQQRWFAHIRNVWGSNLLGGYARLCFPDRERYRHDDDGLPSAE